MYFNMNRNNQMNNPMNNMNNFNNMNNMNNFNNMNNMNNIMMEYINKSMELFNLYKKLNKNIQNSNINIVKSRNNKSQVNRLQINKKEIDLDPFIGYNGPRINVVFKTAKGDKKTINAPSNIKMHALLEKFMEKVGLGPKLINEEIYFLYGGKKITKKDENELVGNYLNDGAILVVLDFKDIIGANYYS